MRKSLIVFFFSVLAGCGFHLRGQVQFSPILSYPWVTGKDLQLVSDLRTALRQNGANPVDDVSTASAIIDIANVEYLRTVKSVDANGTATGYFLEYRVLYRVADVRGKVLVSNTTLTFTRDIVFQSSQVLQKKQEEEALKESMRAEVILRIIRRLDSVAMNLPADSANGTFV